MGRGIKIVTLLLCAVWLFFCCFRTFAQVNPYRQLQEETNRDKLVKAQVDISNLAERVSYQESVHADIRISQIEHDYNHIVNILAAIGTAIMALLVDAASRLFKKRQLA